MIRGTMYDDEEKNYKHSTCKETDTQSPTMKSMQHTNYPREIYTEYGSGDNT